MCLVYIKHECRAERQEKQLQKVVNTECALALLALEVIGQVED